MANRRSDEMVHTSRFGLRRFAISPFPHLALFLLGVITLLTLVMLPLGSRTAGNTGGLLYVANLRSTDVSVVDTATLREVRRFSVAENPHEFVSLAGRLLVSNYRSELVTLLAGNGALREIPVAGEPHGLALAGTTVAVTQGRRGTVTLLDASTLVVRAVVSTDGEPHTAAGFGGRLYVADAANGVLLEIDPEQAAITRRLFVGELPESVAISPDGRTVAVANARSGAISLIERATFIERARVNVPGAPVRVLFTPDGRELVASLNDSGSVAVLDPGAGSMLAVIPAGARPDGLAIAPDGRRLFVALTGSSRVALIDLRARRVSGSIDVGDGPGGLSFVPR